MGFPRAIVAAGGVLLVLAGCGHTTRTASTTTVSPSSSSSAPSPVQTTTVTVPASTPSTSPSGPQGCLTSELRVTLGAGNGTAGAVYYPIHFTNTSAVTCTLDGYPGVSFVAGSAGTQVGPAATHDTTTQVTLVTLAPTAEATAVLRVTDSGVYSPGTCNAKPVNGFRVYPPGATGAAFLPQSGTACATQGLLAVQAVVSGAGSV